MSKPIKNPIYLNSKPRRKSRLIRPSAAKSSVEIARIAELEKVIHSESFRALQNRIAETHDE